MHESKLNSRVESIYRRIKVLVHISTQAIICFDIMYYHDLIYNYYNFSYKKQVLNNNLRGLISRYKFLEEFKMRNYAIRYRNEKK